jgi:hypothetical protein
VCLGARHLYLIEALVRHSFPGLEYFEYSGLHYGTPAGLTVVKYAKIR